jgi:hypothetical protein
VSALADWLDARGAIVHEWYRQGSTLEQIVQRLEVDEQSVRAWLSAPPLPFPGSSRAVVAELRRRVDELERAVLQLDRETEPARTDPAPPPVESDFRALAPKKGER